jgi:hypothetical protein
MLALFKHNRPLWVAVQGLIRPIPYTYIMLAFNRSLSNWKYTLTNVLKALASIISM